MAGLSQPQLDNPMLAVPEDKSALPQDLSRLAMNRTFKIMSLQNIAREKNNEPQLVPGVVSTSKHSPMGSFAFPPSAAKRTVDSNTQSIHDRAPRGNDPGLASQQDTRTKSPVRRTGLSAPPPILPRVESNAFSRQANMQKYAMTIAPWADPRLLSSPQHPHNPTLRPSIERKPGAIRPAEVLHSPIPMIRSGAPPTLVRNPTQPASINNHPNEALPSGTEPPRSITPGPRYWYREPEPRVPAFGKSTAGPRQAQHGSQYTARQLTTAGHTDAQHLPVPGLPVPRLPLTDSPPRSIRTPGEPGRYDICHPNKSIGPALTPPRPITPASWNVHSNGQNNPELRARLSSNSTLRPLQPFHRTQYNTHQSVKPSAAGPHGPLLSTLPPYGDPRNSVRPPAVGLFDTCHPNYRIGTVPRAPHSLASGPEPGYRYRHWGPGFVRDPILASQQRPPTQDTRRSPMVPAFNLTRSRTICSEVDNPERREKRLALEMAVRRNQNFINEERTMKGVKAETSGNSLEVPSLPESARSSMNPIVPGGSEWAKHVMQHGSPQRGGQPLTNPRATYHGAPSTTNPRLTTQPLNTTRGPSVVIPEPANKGSGPSNGNGCSSQQTQNANPILVHPSKATVTASTAITQRLASRVLERPQHTKFANDKGAIASSPAKRTGRATLPPFTFPMPEPRSTVEVAGPSRPQVGPPQVDNEEQQNDTINSRIRRSQEAWVSTVQTNSVRKVQAWLDNVVSELDITDTETDETSAMSEDAKIAAALEEQLEAEAELDEKTVVGEGDWDVVQVNGMN
ncbi:MAG: hypothetical protein M1812_005467 [Candelaria pacifica]|nr:MAG: hypothetical protein M1812_005467 [Candelaria pacifica]